MSLNFLLLLLDVSVGELALLLLLCRPLALIDCCLSYHPEFRILRVVFAYVAVRRLYWYLWAF